MTIICALHQDGQTFIGADSRVLAGGLPLPGPAKKWRVSQDSRRAIGVSGDARTVHLIRQSQIFSATNTPEEVVEFVRDLVRDDGHAGKASEDIGPLRFGNSMIYADANGVWDIDSTFALWRIDDGRLWARGSGMDYALGADHALRSRDGGRLDSRGRVTIAIEAAIGHDVGCGGEIFVQQIGTT